MNWFLRSVPSATRPVFLIHLVYSVLGGLLEGAFYLNEFVLIKSLRGSNYQIAFLFQFSIVILVFAVVLTELTRRFRNKQRMIRALGALTNLPLLVFALFPRYDLSDSGLWLYQTVFLGVFLLHFSARPVLYPAVAAMLKAQYGPAHFGRLFGLATGFNKGAILLSAFVFGVWLDANPYAFVWVYPVLGLLGLGAVWLLSSIPYTDRVPVLGQSLWRAVARSVQQMGHLVRSNKPFRDFEAGFMLYGIGWMVSMAVVTIFFERELQLNYTSVAVYKNVYNVLAIALLPFFGRLIDRIDPRRFAQITFGAFFMHILFMAVTYYGRGHVVLGGATVYYWLVVSYVFYAVFAAAMGLLWHIGAAYFCPDEQVGEYQAIHMSLVGVRAAFAPLIGVYFLDRLGFVPVFGISLAFLASAVGLMVWSLRRRAMARYGGTIEPLA